MRCALTIKCLSPIGSQGGETIEVKDPNAFPVPGRIYKKVRKHQTKIEKERRARWGWKKIGGQRKISRERFLNRMFKASLRYVKRVYPSLIKEGQDLPEIAPRMSLSLPRGADSRAFAIVMMKHIQWEKFVSSGRYDRLRERLITYNFKKKVKQGKLPSKFNNIRCVYDGYNFDSLIEKDRYVFLKLQEKYGVIKDLEVHPKYPLGDDVYGYLIIKSESRRTKATYKPDFRYKIVATEEEIVEDVKSIATLEEYAFKIKRGIWEWLYNKELKVVTSVAAKPGSTRY